MQIKQVGKRLWSAQSGVLLALALAVCGASTALAVTSSSPNYQMTEGEFNAGSMLNSCSGQYCAQASIGDMAVGGKSTSGGTSSASFGSIPASSDPLLEVIIDAGQSDLGVLSTEQTASKTMIVRVRNYLSDGYTLQIVGTPPKFGDHVLSTPGTPTAANPGSEQFGINAVANTSPLVGTNPLQVPSDQTSFGVVESDYGTPNLFKYASEDIVARSNSESGRTDYTISMIVNIASSTPAGHYAGDFSAIVTPVY